MVENLDINQYNDGINHLSIGAGFRNHPQYTPKSIFGHVSGIGFTSITSHYVPIYSHHVGKTIINHPPVITIFIGGMLTIPKCLVYDIVLPTLATSRLIMP